MEPPLRGLRWGKGVQNGKAISLCVFHVWGGMEGKEGSCYETWGRKHGLSSSRWRQGCGAG